MDIKIASDLLSKLNLKIPMENYEIVVKQFKVSDMSKLMHCSRHMHSSFEYHIISSGRCRVILDNKIFEVEAGEFYITGPGVYHEQIGLSSGGYMEYSLDCEINLVEHYDSEADQVVKLLTETECKPFKDTQNIIKLFEQALFEAYHKNIGFYVSIKNLVCSIIISTARTMSRNTSTFKPLGSIYKDNDFRIVYLERFIEDNLAINLSTDDIARYMGLSDKQICRIIKEKTGKSTKNFILSLKLEKTKELLRVSDFSLKHISNSLGFESEIYFNQWFKRRQGIAPGCYRERSRITNTM
jgi:AraC-like DNA-binding protein